VLRPLVIATVLLVAAVSAGCAGGSVSKQEFRQDVLSARNHADAGLAQVVDASSVEDLLARMRIAAVEVRDAATDVRKAPAPDELEDEREQLADRLLALSDEIVSTVETLEAFPEQAASTNALNFAAWDAVQAALAKLRREGIDVRPLARHTPQIERQ